jgi:hypothetical protein
LQKNQLGSFQDNFQPSLAYSGSLFGINPPPDAGAKFLLLYVLGRMQRNEAKAADYKTKWC